MEKVIDLMELARAQAKLSAWPGDGSVPGLPSSSQQPVGSPRLVHFFPQGNLSRESQMKELVYEELIKTGTILGLRKCQKPPRVMSHLCPHPAPALNGAGNQSQKEIWCTECHQRWLVDPVIMSQVQSKQPVIHLNGKTFQFPTKMPMQALPKKGNYSAPEPAPARTPERMVRTPAPNTPTSTAAASSLQGTPTGVPLQKPEETVPRCHCGQPATQLIVKKEGPTQGRLFWKCTTRVCNFFQWDPEEVRKLQRRALQEKEDAEQLKMEQEVAQERAEAIQQTMAAAEERHTALMQEERIRHMQELEQMKAQMFWLSAVAGEERMEQVYNNPLLQQQTMMKAIQLRNQMAEEEARAAQADPGTGSGN